VALPVSKFTPKANRLSGGNETSFRRTNEFAFDGLFYKLPILKAKLFWIAEKWNIPKI
jgi:hypothetical protein